MRSFKEKFMEYLKELPEGQNVVTASHVKEFLEKFQNENPLLKALKENR
jgi:hypothetical protein